MIRTIEAGERARQTLVEEGTAFQGTFNSSCPIVVHGSIRGAVTAPEVTIAPLGAVVGVIKADTLTSSGTLSGTVEAVHVLLSGRVRRDTVVKAQQLHVSLHAERGRMEVTFGPRELDVLDRSPASVARANGLLSPHGTETKSEARTRRSRNKQRRV